MNKTVLIGRYFLPRIIFFYFLNLVVNTVFAYFTNTTINFPHALLDAATGFPLWLAATFLFLKALGKKEVS